MPAYRLTPAVVALLCLTAGTSSASLYYAQPLLNTIAAHLHVSAASAGILVTASQIGYALGLAFLVPLGDLVNRRFLITAMLTAAACASLAVGFAANFSSLCALLVALGISASAAQVVVPFAASLADEDQRGRVTGTVMGGLLLGILLARTVSGAISEFCGWRVVFFTAAGVLILLALLVWHTLPSIKPANTHTYPQLLLSVLALIRRQPILRGRMALGMLSMCAFSTMWTASSFLLARTYHLSDGAIGLFGLVGAAGALAAPLVGRIADRGHGHHTTTASWLCILGGWGLLAVGHHNLAALIGGMLLFDLGIQSALISNQNKIYSLDPGARSRITTAYMVAYFLGGMLGSLFAGVIYEQGGWPAVCAAGAVLATVGLTLWVLLRRFVEHEV